MVGCTQTLPTTTTYNVITQVESGESRTYTELTPNFALSLVTALNSEVNTSKKQNSITTPSPIPRRIDTQVSQIARKTHLKIRFRKRATVRAWIGREKSIRIQESKHTSQENSDCNCSSNSRSSYRLTILFPTTRHLSRQNIPFFCLSFFYNMK